MQAAPHPPHPLRPPFEAGNTDVDERVPGAMKTPAPPARFVATVLAGGLTLAACGGGNPAPPVAEDGTTITLPTPTDGPIPRLPVSAEAAAGSPLPEVTVRRINGEGGFVQLKNALPSDRPLLVWFWAPH